MIPHSHPTINQAEICAVNSVLKSGFLAHGPRVKEFEERFSRYIGLRYAVAVNSGTSALHLALLGLKIRPKDEIILPSYVCTAVLNAVNYVGAIAKIADINREDFNINVESVKKKITRRTKAIIVPHMFGLAADPDALLKLGIPLIEDCALSIGATYKNRRVGSFGVISVFSFYATKMMTTAEGGMLLTNNRDINSYILDLRDYDHKEYYKVRYNYKMSDLAAAMGSAQINKINLFISRRQDIARMYNNGLADLGVQLPCAGDGKTHIYFRYVVRTNKKAEHIINKLERLGIESKRPVHKPLHIYLGLNKQIYPATEEIYQSAVSLPIYPELKDRQVRFIIDKFRQILKG